MSRLRRLDFDDLVILRGFLRGQTIHAIARDLYLTQPAVTQRLRKIEWIFGENKIRKYSGRNVYITEHGIKIAEATEVALSALEAIYDEVHGKNLEVAK